MANKIFLSYRREDSAGQAGRIADRIALEFGPDSLFIDVDSIPLGENFAARLAQDIAKCDVVLAIIGPRWAGPLADGTCRLDSPSDYVRAEIRAALEHKIRLIPILIDGASIPTSEMLPEDIRDLTLQNGLDLRHSSFHADFNRLSRQLTRPIVKGYPLGLMDSEERTKATQVSTTQNPARPRPKPKRNSEPQTVVQYIGLGVIMSLCWVGGAGLGSIPSILFIALMESADGSPGVKLVGALLSSSALCLVFVYFLRPLQRLSVFLVVFVVGLFASATSIPIGYGLVGMLTFQAGGNVAIFIFLQILASLPAAFFALPDDY